MVKIARFVTVYRDALLLQRYVLLSTTQGFTNKYSFSPHRPKQKFIPVTFECFREQFSEGIGRQVAAGGELRPGSRERGLGAPSGSAVDRCLRAGPACALLQEVQREEGCQGKLSVKSNMLGKTVYVLINECYSMSDICHEK